MEWDALSESGLGSSPLKSYTLAILDTDGTGLETEVQVAPEAQSYVFESLVPGNRYSFRIKATNGVGDSAWSDSTSVFYPGVEPTRPGTITFTAATRTSITYSFSALTGQDTGGTDAQPMTPKYHIYISRKEDQDFELLTTSLTATPLTAEYLSPGQWYYFKFQAENSFGLLSEFSTVYRMMPGTGPSAPANSPQLISQAPDLVTFRVVEPSDSGGPAVVRYEIEVSKVQGGSTLSTTLMAQSANVPDMRVFTLDASNGLDPGFEYHVRARCHTYISDFFALTTSWGATATFYASGLPEAIAESSFTYSGLTKTDATINWALLSSAAAKGYSTTDPVYTLQMDLCGRQSSSATQFVTLLTTTTATSHSISGQAPGSTCKFRVLVTNIIGAGPFSVELSVLFAVAPAQQVAAPEFVARSGGNADLDLAPFISIKWVPPLDDGGAPVLGYIVQMKEAANAAAPWSTIYDGGTHPEVREFKLQSAALLTAGLTYSFQTFSRNDKGMSPASASIDIAAATIPEKMVAPTRVSVTIDSATQATVV